MQASPCKCGGRNNFPPDNNWQGCNLSMGRWLDVIKYNKTESGLVQVTQLPWHGVLSSLTCPGLFSSAIILISAQPSLLSRLCPLGQTALPERQSRASARPSILVPVLPELSTKLLWPPKEVSSDAQLLGKSPSLSFGTFVYSLPVSLLSCCSLDSKSS